jgi:APA family basic amino acid/polyamine antiporter
VTDTTISSGRGGTPPPASTGPLFVRQATGLVKGWSALDASIYCFFAISFGAFGFYVFSLACFIPEGSLPWAVVLTTVFLVFEVLVYAAFMAVMPRAGGDYVWQTRVLGGGLGFVLAIAGWWFAMWQFVPIYGSLIVMEVVNPLLGAVGATSAADWFASDDGILVSSIAVVAISSYWVAMGIGGYAKVQKWSLIIGGVGLAIVFGLLLFNSNDAFQAAFDRESAAQFGAGAHAYARTLDVGGIDAVGLSFPSQTWLLIPLVLFWNMWVIWGAVLAGETRGARDMGRNVLSMGGALVAAAVLALVFFGLAAKTFGWDFYNSANGAYWGAAYGTLPEGVQAPLSTWPSPVMLAGWLVDSAAFQVVLILLNAFWLIGLLGTLFLSATRVIFAAAFDRVLPEPVSKVTKKRRVPWVALLLLMVPGIVVSFLYAYWGNFATYVLNTALLLAVTFLGTAVAAIVLPFRMKNLYRTSPLARFEFRGIPLISVCGAAFAVFLLFNLYYWLTDDVYGVNNRDSMIYLGVLYALAIAIFAVSSFVRRRQGVRLTQVHREIPAD